jgi:trans-aconitate methyltransferase
MPSIYTANDPSAYERSVGRWSRRLAGPFIDFAAIGDAARIVDIGCDTGSPTFARAEVAPGAEIVGIDDAQAYVDHARSSTPEGHGSGSSKGMQPRWLARIGRSTQRCPNSS